MTRNRHQRRAMKSNAAANSAMLARCCFDYDGEAMLPVTDPLAIAVLEQAFTRMMQAGACPCPRPRPRPMPFRFMRGRSACYPVV